MCSVPWHKELLSALNAVSIWVFKLPQSGLVQQFLGDIVALKFRCYWVFYPLAGAALKYSTKSSFAASWRRQILFARLVIIRSETIKLGDITIQKKRHCGIQFSIIPMPPLKRKQYGDILFRKSFPDNFGGITGSNAVRGNVMRNNG